MTGKERREQLVNIGRKLFAERGFEGTSIEEIAAQAGVSKPVVYEHFGRAAADDGHDPTGRQQYPREVRGRSGGVA
jgi:transposase